jgi:cytochrome c oxidase assembly protein subunit 15
MEQAAGRADSRHADAAGIDWRDTIPHERRRPLRLWLWSIAAITFGVLVVGGITRLTLSGLSIVDWNPIMGAIPPLGDAQWQQAFDLYRQSPDYAWRQGMTLADFRFIYFWEYLHRLLARTIGLVFLVPFVVFLVRGWLTRPLLTRTLALFGLGAMQGVMGWLMVASGLVDRPSVSHYRLAAHLTLAFLIFGYALWLARDIGMRRRSPIDSAQHTLLRRGLSIVGVVLAVQIVWGAFVAGLRAGKYYPTFPLMGGRLVPLELLSHESPLHDFVANPIAVQWTHRVIGTLLALLVIALFVIVRRRVDDPVSRSFSAALLLLILAQYALGIATLVLLVPVSLGVIHQATALVVFGVWLMWVHHAVQGGAASVTAAPAPRPAAAHPDPA